MYFNGLPEMNISDINIENVIISSYLGAQLSDVRNVIFKNVGIYATEGPALLLNDVKNMKVSDFKHSSQEKGAVKISGSKSENISLPQNIQNQ